MSPKSGGLENGLAGVHPADVAADGVDFAVVSDVAVGMREFPAWEGVGGEALVNETERAGDERVCQFEVELLDLGGEHQALVDDGAAGEGGNVEELLVLDIGGGNLVFGAAANEIERRSKSSSVMPSGRPTKNCSI